jgi:hypothetical protein
MVQSATVSMNEHLISVGICPKTQGVVRFRHSVRDQPPLAQGNVGCKRRFQHRGSKFGGRSRARRPETPNLDNDLKWIKSWTKRLYENH